MKVYFHIKQSDLEYLNNILKDYNNMKDALEISFIPSLNTIMVSLSVDDFIRLQDNEVFATLISL